VPPGTALLEHTVLEVDVDWAISPITVGGGR
jgi:hypothetical protein